jgi:hypothetical protein
MADTADPILVVVFMMDRFHVEIAPEHDRTAHTILSFDAFHGKYGFSSFTHQRSKLNRTTDVTKNQY